jgi:hypothetical protein
LDFVPPEPVVAPEQVSSSLPFLFHARYRGLIVRKELLHELAVADDEEVIEGLLETSPHVEPADGYAVEALRADVEADRGLLDELGQNAGRVRPENDPKLAALLQELAKIRVSRSLTSWGLACGSLTSIPGSPRTSGAESQRPRKG